nr:hypothetical protein [Sporocytophaga myxococcoides]
MLEYSIHILEKVSFDKSLFEKELNKSINLLSPQETLQLEKWVEFNYGEKFPDIIKNFKNLYYISYN